VLLTVTAMMSLTLLWPVARGLFRFGPLHWDDLAVTLAAGAAVLVVLEFLKPIWRKRPNDDPKTRRAVLTCRAPRCG
jgi:P-type Ca2+ transporter type 2C